jgi:hypothetical protein
VPGSDCIQAFEQAHGENLPKLTVVSPHEDVIPAPISHDPCKIPVATRVQDKKHAQQEKFRGNIRIGELERALDAQTSRAQELQSECDRLQDQNWTLSQKNKHLREDRTILDSRLTSIQFQCQKTTSELQTVVQSQALEISRLSALLLKITEEGKNWHDQFVSSEKERSVQIFDGDRESIEAVLKIQWKSPDKRCVMSSDAKYLRCYMSLTRDGIVKGLVGEMKLPPEVAKFCLANPKYFMAFNDSHKKEIAKALFVIVIAPLDSDQRPFPIAFAKHTSEQVSTQWRELVGRVRRDLILAGFIVCGEACDGDPEWHQLDTA